MAEVRGLASLSELLSCNPAQLRRMPFWDQPTPALANWRKTLGEAISLNGNRVAVNRALCWSFASLRGPGPTQAALGRALRIGPPTLKR
jgi:hypothetical protein